MDSGLHALTEKERHALRLIGRGHDAKSCARELGLSVHTVNERLRIARRKLGVTSSREAARFLLAQDARSPENSGDRFLGDAELAMDAAHPVPAANRRLAGIAAAILGVSAMSLIIALLLPAAPLAIPALSPATPAAAIPAAAQSDAAARATGLFLHLIDHSRWEESYAATGASFAGAIPSRGRARCRPASARRWANSSAARSSATNSCPLRPKATVW